MANFNEALDATRSEKRRKTLLAVTNRDRRQWATLAVVAFAEATRTDLTALHTLHDNDDETGNTLPSPGKDQNMIEYDLPWKLTDHQAEVLQRETIAIMELLLARKSHTSNKTIRLIAMVECLAFAIAAYACREDDDQRMEELLDDLTANLKISVWHIKAAHSAKELIERLRAK